MTNFKYLNVFWEDRLAGRLERQDRFHLAFQYDQAWQDDDSLPAVSRSLPKGKTALKAQHVNAYGSAH